MGAHFSKKLLSWHDPAARNLPWKKTRDPYKIWLSEIILQQTRVEQGLPYYLAFVNDFPNVKSLARAPLEAVLKRWEGLGYYSRARNLHMAAREIVENHGGHFPERYGEIRALKGVGDYTAAAIASFAFGLPYAVVDGNVYRVLARIFGIGLPIDSTAGKKYFQDLAQQLIDKKQPGAYNQALMDFGAIVCQPRNPGCHLCPFSSECKANLEGRIEALPVKSKAAPKAERHFHYFVVTDGRRVLIRQRIEKDIWEKLYEFRLAESPDASVRIPADLKPLLKKRPEAWRYRQVLSHRVIHGHFYEVRVKSLKNNTLPGMKSVLLSELNRYAFPKIIRLYLQERLKWLS